MPFKKGMIPHNKGDVLVKRHFRDAPNVKRELDFKQDLFDEDFLSRTAIKPFKGRSVGF